MITERTPFSSGEFSFCLVKCSSTWHLVQGRCCRRLVHGVPCSIGLELGRLDRLLGLWRTSMLDGRGYLRDTCELHRCRLLRMGLALDWLLHGDGLSLRLHGYLLSWCRGLDDDPLCGNLLYRGTSGEGL